MLGDSSSLPGTVLIAESATQWTEALFRGGLRLLGILLVAFLLVRLLRALTKRLVHLASTQTRSALLHEQQTRTLAGILYSAGTFLILAVAVLTALPEFGIDVTPIAAAA